MAIRQDAAGQRTVWCWGQQGSGRLGNAASTTSPIPVPGSVNYAVQVKRFDTASTPLVPLTNVVQIAAGPAHSVALDSAGTVWTWGNNEVASLGHDGTTNKGYAGPVSLPVGAGPIVAIGAGGYELATTDQYGNPVTYIYGFTLALDKNGTLYGWGYNAHGQTGDNTTTSHGAPKASNFPIKFSDQAPVTGLSLSVNSGTEPASFTLTATPSDGDGPGDLAKVDFYQNGTLLGTATAVPWQRTTSGLLAGNYTFKAVVTDSQGVTGSSAPVVVYLPFQCHSINGHRLYRRGKRHAGSPPRHPLRQQWRAHGKLPGARKFYRHGRAGLHQPERRGDHSQRLHHCRHSDLRSQ